MSDNVVRLTFDTSEFTPEEHIAWNYCLARDYPERFAQPFLVVWQFHVKQVGETLARQQRNKGLEGLMEKGIISGLKRDGHRDWDLVGGQSTIHFTRVTHQKQLITRANVGQLILGEGE